jgi:MFS family permease
VVGTGVAGSTTTGTARPALLVGGLSIVVLTVAVLQTAVVPVLGVIGDQLGASTVAVSWVVTANLLAAIAATPLLGRLADLYSKKRVLLGVLLVVLIGSVIAAVTSSLPLLIVARVLQGASYALYPISVAVLREELPHGRLAGAMAVMSGTLGFGGGVGLVVVGLLMSGDADYHRVFWLTTGFTVAVLAIVMFLVPARRRRGAGSIDWLGAIGLAAGLSTVLLAITQGNAWGWVSGRTLVCATCGAAVLVAWWLWEKRRVHPLVSTRMLTRPAMLLTNLATIFVGMGLYFAFLGLTQFVQIPRQAAGYGFGASVLESSVVYLLPGAVTGFAVALVSGRFIDRFGARRVLVVAAMAGVVGFVLLAVAHDQPWQVIVAGILANAYISLGYGALPALVVAEVEAGQTGVATGINAIARTVGSSVAAAVVAVLLGRSAPGTAVPMESSFVVVFVAGAVTAAFALTLIALTRTRPRSADPDAVAHTREMNHEWG